MHDDVEPPVVVMRSNALCTHELGREARCRKLARVLQHVGVGSAEIGFEPTVDRGHDQPVALEEKGAWGVNKEKVR
jgi:hypothetical protein